VVGVVHGEVEDRIIDEAIHPATNAGIGLRPCRISRTCGQRDLDVAKEPVIGVEGGEEHLPLVKAGALKAEDDRHMLLDVDSNVGGEERRSEGVCHGTAEVAEEMELDVLELVVGVVMTTQREEDDRATRSAAARSGSATRPENAAWPGSGAA